MSPVWLGDHVSRTACGKVAVVAGASPEKYDNDNDTAVTRQLPFRTSFVRGRAALHPSRETQ